MWGPTQHQLESLLQEFKPQMSAETAIEGIADWFFRTWGDKKEQADLRAIEDWLGFWENPSQATKAKALASTKIAIAANAAANPPPFNPAPAAPVNDDLTGSEVAGPNAANRR